MRNVGTVPVHNLDLEWSCEESGGGSPQLTLETAELGASLPLQPRQQLSTQLVVRGQLNNNSYRTEDCMSLAGSESRWSASGRG
jgi:hypothetical protein